MMTRLTIPGIVCGFVFFAAAAIQAATPVEISGRYPHLAMSNHQGECGTGAVVPWAGRLWVITYGPHLPNGSDDKLYEIDENLARTIRPESVGGTPANRMIHRESNQLNIGPYFIDAKGNVRVIPPAKMFGRLTATARHLTDPANKLYIYDMEGLLYEVDVHTLDVKLLFKRPVPGWHGKGCYSGQGRLIFANNGCNSAGSVDRFKPFDYFISPKITSQEDSGVLADWDGKAWSLIQRRQFTDITGPGGIFGPANDEQPVWAIGWDSRSVLLELCDHKQWKTFRVPISDYTYVAKHGWYTEWPRIREVTDGHYLMNMHGGWFEFPKTFADGKTGGIRAIGDYLKITGDFCAWNGRIVFGCDDTTAMALPNAMAVQSNSNLWFTSWDNLAKAGRPAGSGGPWLRDDVKAHVASEPYLFAGYEKRVLHLSHASAEPVAFAVEIDQNGDGRWTPYQTITVEPNGYQYCIFPADLKGEWIRLRPDRDAAKVTAYFNYGPGGGAVTDRKMFDALADVDQSGPWTAAVVRCEGRDTLKLGVLAKSVDASGDVGPARTYQCDDQMQFTATTPDSESAKYLLANAEVKQRTISSDAASVIVTVTKPAAKGKHKKATPAVVQRFRLPKSAAYEKTFATGWPRSFREVVTERQLLNADGTFYDVPYDDAGGVLRMKPVCTHNKRITDFCSWRGLLVLAGCSASAKPDGHYFAAENGVGLWFGDIDDLWRLGKPVGRGGPWADTAVRAGELSDPYLMAGYDRKTLQLSHDAAEDVAFTILVDVAADGHWLPYKTIHVPAGKTVTEQFPDGYSAHWVRLKADKPCKATATLIYE